MKEIGRKQKAIATKDGSLGGLYKDRCDPMHVCNGGGETYCTGCMCTSAISKPMGVVQ